MSINDYPYTNMVYQNIDWLINEVNKLKNQGKTAEETTESVNKSVFAGQGMMMHSYPYTNMVYQNIDWLIQTVYNLVERVTITESAITEIRNELLNLAEEDNKLWIEIGNLSERLNNKVDKVSEANVVYCTDKVGATTIKKYTENGNEANTIVVRNLDGYIFSTTPTSKDINQYNDRLILTRGASDERYVKAVEKGNKIYGTNESGAQYEYEQSAKPIRYTIPLRTTTGTIMASEAIEDNELVTLAQLENTASETLLEAKEYTDKHGSGGWETVAEVVAEADTVLSPINYNEKGEDITGIKISVYADSSSDVNVEVYDETVSVDFTDESGEDGVSVATISDCLPRVFGKAQETSKYIELNEKWMGPDGTFYPANTSGDLDIGQTAMQNPTAITDGGNSKISIKGIEETINSILPNRTVDIYNYTTVEGTVVINSNKTVSVQLPPDSDDTTCYRYTESDGEYSTPKNKLYLDTVMKNYETNIRVYSLAGEENPYTITSVSPVYLEKTEFYYYEITVTSTHSDTYVFRWYSDTKYNDERWNGFYNYGANAPADLAFRIYDVQVPALSETVNATGFYNNENPDAVVYITSDGKIYASTEDINGVYLTYTQVVPTEYKGIFTAEISIYGENAVCTRIEGTNANIEKFTQTVPVNNSGNRYACITKPYIKINLNSSNTLYAGSKIRIETISTKDKE